MTTLRRLPPTPPLPTLTNDQAEALNRHHKASVSSVNHCVTCGGRGSFMWLDPQTGEDAEFECPCRDQYVLSRWLWHSGVLPRWQRLGWADMVDLSEQTSAQALDYLANLDAYQRQGIGLTLTGPIGSGKTLLAHLVVKEAIGKGVDCYATTFSAMIDQFAGGWRDRDEARWFDRRVRDARLLFIDDLGRERNKGEGSVGDSMLETVVRHRVACLLPTIITTNITEDRIGQAYGGHTYSLLSESAVVVEVPGADQRPAMKARELSYMRRGLTRPVVLG